MDEHLSTRRALRRPEGTTTLLAATSEPRIRTEVLHFHTTGSLEFWDLTDLAREVVARSGVRHGQVTLHTLHTTTSLVVNEAETGFFNDFRRLVQEVVPVERYYEHDDHGLRTENIQEDELLNGHAHCGQMLAGSASVTSAGGRRRAAAGHLAAGHVPGARPGAASAASSSTPRGRRASPSGGGQPQGGRSGEG